MKIEPQAPPVPLPICDVCNKPVQEIFEEFDCYRDARVWAVRCHGQVEVAEIPRNMLVMGGKIEIGRAFVARRLTA